MSQVERLQQQVRDLQRQIAGQKETIASLKDQLKAAVRAEGAAGRRTEVGRDAEELQTALIEAEHANRLKSEFLETVSHEIRTSMNGIVGMTSLVLETELTREQEQYLEMVNTSVDRLLEVVNEVLDFSKIESGVLELEPTDFNLKESLDYDLYVLKTAAEQKGLFLTCDIGVDVPEVVNGDPKRLVQIVTNLVNNAIKFTSQGGVSLKVTSKGYDAANRLFLHFAVQDSGVGLRLEQLQHIRAAMANTEARPLPAIEGLGLGLTISSQLVGLMGGEIGVESDSKGTTFWFSVPFKEVVDLEIFEQEDGPGEAEAVDTALYALQGARVLLAEDDPINRVLTETILTQAGMDVTAVEDGSQAVAQAKKGNFQIILMDVQMPQMDGLEATRKIRQQEKQDGRSRGVILALTAHAMHGDREKCLQAGMDDYLSKPIDRVQLLNLLTKYLTNTALVVESDMESQQMIMRFLIEKGWSVTLAETGRAAMYEASLNHFDLIVLDSQMPQVDGIEAARVIRKLEQYSGQHAIILAIEATDKGSGKGQIGGVDGSIARPVSPELLGEKLHQLNPSW